MIKKFLLLTLLCALAAGQAMAQEAQKREMRSTWIATVWAIDWPNTTGTSASVQASQKKALTTMLDSLQAQNFNCVFFQVRSMCDAMYKSAYEPWSSYLTGSRGTDPGWDPLAYAVEQAHQRGMELHAWVNPYRWSSSNTTWSTSQDRALSNAGLLLSYNGTTILNPGLKASRERIVNVCKDIITHYDVDGIIFDDYFYPSGIPATSAAGDYSTYQDSGSKLSFADWRRANVNQMVQDVWNMIQQTKPQVRFGIGPAGVADAPASKYGLSSCPGSDWQYSSIYSEPLAWYNAGTIDYMSPQIYWKTNHSTNPFGPITQWWSVAAHKFGRHHFASHSISFLASQSNTQSDWAEVVKQVQYSRQYNQDNAPGVVLYSTKNINGDNRGKSGLGNYLHYHLFQHPALVPAMTWKQATALGTVQGLTFKSSRLSWTAVSGTLIKYAVYAIPDAVTATDAQSSTFGGIKSDYLLGLTYTSNYTLPQAVRSGYWYAVTIVDGFGNEYAPATVNEPRDLDPSPVTTLTAPADGAQVTGDFTFSCTNVGAGSYTLQVSRSQAFEQIDYSAPMTVGSEAVTAPMQVARLGKGTFYWRVATQSEGHKQSLSQVRSYTVTRIPTGNYEAGYVVKRDIDTYPVTGGMTLTNLWMRSVKRDYSNLTFDLDGAVNRGFTVIGDRIYVSGRSANSSAATSYIAVYDAATGEHITDLDLGNSVNASLYPCNDVLSDDAGHLLVTNLTTNVGSNPLYLYQVDTLTAQVTPVESFTVSGLAKPRIDHCGLVGNVATGNYTVLATTSYGTQLVSWRVSGGNVGQARVTDLQGYAPASAQNVGIASRVMPLSATDVLVSGGSTYLTRYNAATGAVTGSLEGNTALQPLTTEVNGGAAFTLGTARYLLYPYGNENSTLGFQFMLARNTTGEQFGGYSPLFTFPARGMGEVYSATWAAPVVTREGQDGSRLLYVYAPGNGLAAYRLAPSLTRGDVNRDGNINASDVTAMVNMILGTVTIDYETADLNGDGTVNAADVTALVSLILNAGNAK